MSKPTHIARTGRTYKDADGIEKTRWYEIGSLADEIRQRVQRDAVCLPVDGQFSLFMPTERPNSRASNAPARPVAHAAGLSRRFVQQIVNYRTLAFRAYFGTQAAASWRENSVLRRAWRSRHGR
jgi:hypothetical protein